MKISPRKKLGEVCEIIKGKSPKLYEQKEADMLPYLGARFMRGSKDAEYAFISDKNSVAVSKNDLIIICDGSKSGDMFSGFEGILSSTMGKMKFSEKEIEPKYLKRFLELNFDLFNNAKKGAAIPHLDFNIFKNLEIPVPTIADQRKIVARLEKLLAKIKEAKQLRAEAQEATQNLLSAELHKIFEQGKKKGWQEKELGEICKKISNIKWNENKNKSFQYIDLTSVSREKFSIKETREVDYKNAPSRAKKIIKTNDIIFGTTRPTLMRVTSVPLKYNGHICSTGFIVLRAKTRDILPKFIFYFIRSEQFMERMKNIQTGATYPAVSDTNVLRTKILVPPVAEQKKIITRLDALSEKIKKLQEYQNQTQADLIALEKSILHQSFKNN